MNTIEQRLQVLERDLQRSRRSNRLLVFAVLTVACLAGAQAKPQQETKPPTPAGVAPTDGHDTNKRASTGHEKSRTLEARAIVLHDHQGRTRIRMGMDEDGPAICLLDEEGKKRVELSHTTASSGLRLFDSTESPVVSLQLPENVDRARLEIVNPQGSSTVQADGIAVHDSAHQRRLQLALLNGNFPILGISDGVRSGPPSIELTASDGSRRLNLHDNDGNALFSLTASDDDGTTVSLRHPDNQRSLQILAGPNSIDGPAISFFGPVSADGTGGMLPFLRFGLHNDRQPYVRIVDSEGRTRFAAPSN